MHLSLSPTSSRTLKATAIAVTLAAALAALPTSSPREGALAWARGLSDADRVSYTAPGRLQELPIVYRMAVFSTLSSAEQRAQAWRNVFKAYAQSHSLSLQQQAALDQAERVISAALFIGARTPEQNASVAAAREAIVASLGQEARYYLFKHLGPAVETAAHMPVYERLAWSWRTKSGSFPVTGPLNATDPACNCNYASNDDCWGHQNCRSPYHCVEREPWWGCGDVNWCDRMCSFDPVID